MKRLSYIFLGYVIAISIYYGVPAVAQQQVPMPAGTFWLDTIAGIWRPASQTNPMPTLNIGPESAASLSFPNGQPISLLAYDFGSGTLNTSSQFNRPITGGGGNATAATNAVGQTTIGTGTTAGGFSILISQRTIWDRNPGYNYYQGNINVPIPSVQNAYMLFGFVAPPYSGALPAPTIGTPAQNAAAFEFGVNGKLSAVTFASGTRQLVADLSVAQGNTPVSTQTSTGAAGTFTGGCACTPQISAAKPNGSGGFLTITDSYKYVILFRGDNILWYIEQPNGTLGLVAYTTRGAVGLDVNQVTLGYLAMANSPTGPAATATMQINQLTVGDTAKNAEPGFDRSVYPQQALTAVNDAVGVSAMGAGSCTFTTVSNTNVTLVFEATDPNGTTWNSVLGYPWLGGTGISTVPSGTNGQWTVPCAGLNQVRMRVSAIGATPTVLGTATASVGTTPNGINLNPNSPGIIANASPGTPNTTTVLSVQGEPGMVAVNVQTSDPCTSAAKSSVPINITTATTTSLVAVSGSTTVYVCGVSMTVSEVITTPNTILFEYGTGAACSGPVALTGKYGDGGVTAGIPIVVNASNGGTVFKSAASNGICALTAIGTTASFQGVMTYVQQ